MEAGATGPPLCDLSPALTERVTLIGVLLTANSPSLSSSAVSFEAELVSNNLLHDFVSTASNTG